MKKINTSPIAGAQELLPKAQAKFDQLKSKITDIYQQHGFLHIETPIIERSEILFAKAGGETEKQIYKVFKTGESGAKTKEALRFDHTVPLARYVVEHENDLAFPFKVTQVARNFRGERPQKGRFRELYQCDIDVIGRNTLSLSYDADIIATLLEAFEAFDLKTPVLARISNRKILSGILEELKLREHSAEIYHIIDHAEKVTIEKTKSDLEELKLEKSIVKKLLDFIKLNGERSEVITSLLNMEIKNAKFNEGVNELDQILHLLETMELGEKISADMKIVRGLDYYTGTVFEFILPEYKNIGSVCGGGRYDNLATYFSDKTSFPGVGGSIGLTRLFSIFEELKLIKKSENILTDYAIIPVTEAEVEYAFSTAKDLRGKDKSSTVVLLDKKYSDKMSYAAKVARSGIVIGKEEVESGRLEAKNFETGEYEIVSGIAVENPLSDPSDFWAD
ncbi:histidine--tRNA ligase [Candidatus Saccharibacteria bacterium]|nr:histidine--tRNA ligase [Candidatus Saccharibacteria bacterium]